MVKSNNRSGFTLVELMVVILCATLVTAAALSTMLLGMRIHNAALEDARQQNEVRIFHTLLQNLAGNGSSAGYLIDDTGSSWYLSIGGTVINNTIQSIRMGETVILDGVESSTLSVSDTGNLLTFEIVMKSGETYNFTIGFTSVSELQISPKNNSLMRFSVERSVAVGPRDALVSVAEAQLGSTGQIMWGERAMDQWYTQWYTRESGNDEWSTETPWCGCFVSWAAAQQAVKLPEGSRPYFANVEDGMAGFRGEATGNGAAWNGSWQDAGDYIPQAGDFIFFNTDPSDDGPDHVGLVTGVSNGTVYTIEGNAGTPGKVLELQYDLTDRVILGYGLLNWQ